MASQLFFSDVLPMEAGPELGLGEPPEASLELELADGERVALWIGTPTEQNAFHATNPAWPKPWCVALPAATAEVLFAAIDEVAQGLGR